ncbi:MAG: hypothetical protein LBS74_04915 [Oscillospiraceae bacterium]|jgi:hypothetical protein|nr:hypothetical protein [Oscillospiraceae bacterium]
MQNTVKWYKKKSVIFGAVIIVVLIVAGCIIAALAKPKSVEGNTSSSVSASIEAIKEAHYGVYSEAVSSPDYYCNDINGNPLRGVRMLVEADMKYALSPEEIVNDAIALDKALGAIETEVRLYYRLDPSQNVTIVICRGEIVDPLSHTYSTKEDWIAQRSIQAGGGSAN